MSIRRSLTHSLLLAVAGITVMAGLTQVAKAECGFAGCYGYGQGYAYGPMTGSGFFEMPYATGRVKTPPYFALHPPVYYSAPVPRTYGYSPFAYPGTHPTPEIVEPTGPAAIVNPYAKPMKQEPKTQETAHRVVGRSTRVSGIINPFAGRSLEVVSVQP